MRILQVRLKNLNSLIGAWEIDFTRPAFSSDGIFAITGPTGAGKTTILDAICLALYGRTPRLNKVTKSDNEIMSRQTGACFAEVTFETRSGRFQCHWSQHRARKKADGELQPPRHEIASADSGDILESTIRGVAECVEAVTGMDFDRFTRSMLLAQGEFAAFLQAAADERAPLLEQITGTEIYSRISIRTHERRREEREKLNLLEAETAGIVILPPEEEKELERDLEAKKKEEAELTGRVSDMGQALTWLSGIDGLKKEIGYLAEEARKMQSDVVAFQAKRDKLGLALRAASLDGFYATLSAIRKQQREDHCAFTKAQDLLPELERSAKEREKSLQAAEQQTMQAKERLNAAMPHMHSIRSLDLRLAEQKKAIAECDELCNTYAAKIDADKQAGSQEQARRGEAEKSLARVDGYLKEHAQDEWLLAGLTGVEEQLGNLLAKQQEIARKEADCAKATAVLQQASKALDDCRKQCGMRTRELEKAVKNLKRGKDALRLLLGDRLLREYRSEKESLLREMAFLATIAEMEAHRARLEDGKPCPLCGAKEHPFAQGNVPVPHATEERITALSELIGKAEAQEAVIKSCEEAVFTARTDLADTEKRETISAHEQKAAEQTLAGVAEGLEKLRSDCTAIEQAVLTKLQPLGIMQIAEFSVSSLLQQLQERRHAWQEHLLKKNEIEKSIGWIDGELKRLEAVIATQGDLLIEHRNRLKRLKHEYAAGCDERKQLYGDKHPDDEERRLNREFAVAEDEEKKVRARYHELQKELLTAKSHVALLQKRIEQRDPELKRLEDECLTALAAAGFADELQFLAARLSAEQREVLSGQAKALDDGVIDLAARQKDREKRLAVELAKKITDKPLAELAAHFKECEASLQQLRNSIAQRGHALHENAAAKARIRMKQTAIEAQQRECRRWDNLHELIGSADGKKYRNFAQGLTFELMIGHANRQLRNMTDRYLLIRDESQPLELSVIDNYQAGEVRSTKNLSGGESFLVSLAQALGLSHMAGKKIRVDSLFLDEGFGTLDEEALDTALETLAGLHRDGKLIGVISHVAALQERIASRIEVRPQSGGRSVLVGVGCRRIAS